MAIERTSDNFDVNAILALLGSNGGVASATPEAQPSTADAQPEYIYMTLGEKLQILREMEANSVQYADQAISRGLISPNQRPDFQNLISANVRMMEEQRSNINFDPATSPNARLVNSAPPNMSSALDQIIVDQYVASNDQANSTSGNTIAAVNSVEDAFAAEVEEMTDDIRFNPSSNLSEEAAQILNSPMAARLYSGVLMNLRAAVNLQEEKQENGSAAFVRGDSWNERRERDQKDRDEKANAAKIADDIQDIQQQQEQQRQQRAEAWRNEEHDYAGQRMTGAQWMQLIQWFKQPENRAAWEDAMVAETGQSRDQVRATGDKIERLDELIEKQSRGEELTAQEQAELERLNNDRDVQEGMRIRREQMDRQQGVRPELSSQADTHASITSGETTSVTATVDASLEILSGKNASGAIAPSRTSLATRVEGRGEFAATAPSLRANFVAANAATGAPLDQPAPQVVVSAAPVEASVSVSGMDV